MRQDRLYMSCVKKGVWGYNEENIMEKKDVFGYNPSL
jgi:hypothetical protein